ncbi:hypothetical protein U8607_23740 [Methylobacterium durans]|uniref:hypothetical protein n=1 Tax=Methylobacterium durans TaxID=2202825 RepID=UPI002AFF1804|nr:hypothetical protein [Methylobacterium durans]MEA1835106.1 hypothetical protein [Methylobacterium durans]
MPRTGSTSFQAVLTNLRPRLAEAGILYPDLTPPGSPHGTEVNHQPLGEALDGRRPPPERAAALKRLADVLAGTSADTVILSYEDFSVQKPALGVPATLADLFRRHGFAVEVAMVVKPVFEQLNSAYAHRTQLVQETRSFRAYAGALCGSGRFAYHALVEPWLRAADGRVTGIPLRDARSDAPLLERMFRDLGLSDRTASLISPETLRFVTNRSSGPVAVEASRRLRRLRAHRQVPGHPRQIGHVIDEAAWARGLDPEPFRGDAPEMRARVDERYGASNERFARAVWGRSWSQVVAPAPERAPNELATRPIPARTEAEIAAIVAETIRHFGLSEPPAWRSIPAEIAEAGVDRLARLIGYTRWRVP